jgi:hypothetical protein
MFPSGMEHVFTSKNHYHVFQIQWFFYAKTKRKKRKKIGIFSIQACIVVSGMHAEIVLIPSSRTAGMVYRMRMA